MTTSTNHIPQKAK